MPGPMKKRYPLIHLVEWLKANRVRLFFSTGRIVEVKLPIRSAKRAKIVFGGVGLDPGDGRELSAVTLHRLKAEKIWANG